MRAGVALCQGGVWEPGSLGCVPLQDTTPDELLAAVLTAVLQDVKLRPEQLGDISVGEPATWSSVLPSPHFPALVFTDRTGSALCWLRP